MSHYSYKKGHHLHANFSKADHEAYDSLGRSFADDFFSSFGWKVKNFDLSEENKVDYNRPDLMCTRKNSKDILVEVGVKDQKLWKFTSEGIDVEARKLKYVKNFKDVFLFLARSDGQEHFIIPMWLLELAQDSCGVEYFGHPGRFRSVKTSENFSMPSHGCCRVRKWCQRGSSWIEDDFYRIPKKYAFHYVKKEERKYSLVGCADFSVLKKNENERCLRCQMKLLGC